MSYTENARKRAAKHLRESILHKYQVALGSARAHEVVAATMGFNSSIAAKSAPGEVLSPRFPDEFELEDNSVLVKERLVKMSSSAPELSDLIPKVDQVTEFAVEGLRPECDFCGKFFDSHRIEGHEDRDEDEPVWVCTDCLVGGKERVAVCGYCDPGRNIHLMDDLDPRNGLCSEHRDEAEMDPEELQGWMDHVENITKDN